MISTDEVLLISAGWLLLGLLGGVLIGRRSKRDAPAAAPANPATCGCSHSLGLHKKLPDGSFGACGQSWTTRHTVYDNPSIWHTELITRECKCQHYDGPIPLPMYFDPGQLS